MTFNSCTTSSHIRISHGSKHTTGVEGSVKHMGGRGERECVREIMKIMIASCLILMLTLPTIL